MVRFGKDKTTSHYDFQEGAIYYLPFGRCGLRVSALCLGTARFGGGEGGLEAEQARAVFGAYLDAGGNFIDTATNYNGGRSEEALGPLIAGLRDRLVIASKYGMGRPGDPIAAAGAARKSLRLAVERSLKRLGTDHLDILYLHQWDFDTAAEEVLQAMGDMVARGMVDQIAVSNAPAWTVARCDALAELRGWRRFAGMQIGYSLLDRSADREVLPMADSLELGVAAWWPLWSGRLARPIAPGDPDDADDPRERAIVGTVAEVAGRMRVPMAQVALAWLAQRRPTPIVPVVGADSADQVRSCAAAMALTLDPAELAALDEVSAVDPGYPYGFLRRQSFRDMGTAYQADQLRSRVQA